MTKRVNQMELNFCKEAGGFHGGMIVVEDSEDKGNRFYLRTPVSKVVKK
jgi:signal transduction histidine kinase